MPRLTAEERRGLRRLVSDARRREHDDEELRVRRDRERLAGEAVGAGGPRREAGPGAAAGLAVPGASLKQAADILH